MAKNWHHSKEYRVWRIGVIRRDKVCVVCGTRKSRQAHHINHGTYFPEQRYDLDNGITLCRNCHSRFHNDFVGSYRRKCTKYQFDNFMQLVGYFKELWYTNKQN